VIHFNNGLHGWGYTESQYRDGLMKTVAALKKYSGDAQLIWAATTPVRDKTDLDAFAERTERVKARNQVALEIMTEQEVPTDDLFELVKERAEWTSGDGVHFNGPGNEALAKQVATVVLESLNSPASSTK
jgi:lysophospholipase L1-like esterase